MNDPDRGRAVVLGASMAGLLAARVLADAYSEVTVIERDRLPEAPAHRRGVPQGRHAHALLARGLDALEELLPGVTAELVARGAPTGDMLRDARLHFGGHRLLQAPSGVKLISASRVLLEDAVRRRVRQLSGVRFAAPSEAVGLTIASRQAPERVTGVRVVGRSHGSAAEVYAAELVVDATGRRSRAPEWLEAIGFSRPREDRICMDLHYTSRCYRLAPGALGGNIASVQAATAANPRAGVLARLEGDQWLLTLAGILGDRPPSEPAGFVAFARTLPFPDIHAAIHDGEPLDAPSCFRFRESSWRRYERMQRLPAGFIPLGDSLCSFNPVYGQGMTVAALEALALARHLARPGRLSTERVVRDFARLIEVPWAMARGADLALPGVLGRRSWPERVLGAYIARLHAAAARDARLGAAFVRVSGLVDPPPALLRPSLALRVLRQQPNTH